MNINKEIFTNALVKGDQVKVLDMQSQIYIVNLFPESFFLWTVFRNFIFA